MGDFPPNFDDLLMGLRWNFRGHHLVGEGEVKAIPTNWIILVGFSTRRWDGGSEFVRRYEWSYAVDKITDSMGQLSLTLFSF